jgi:hypothetical protein
MSVKKTSPALISTQRKTTTSGIDDENIALRRINNQPIANDDGHSRQ